MPPDDAQIFEGIRVNYARVFQILRRDREESLKFLRRGYSNAVRTDTAYRSRRHRGTEITETHWRV